MTLRRKTISLATIFYVFLIASEVFAMEYRIPEGHPGAGGPLLM